MFGHKISLTKFLKIKDQIIHSMFPIHMEMKLESVTKITRKQETIISLNIDAKITNKILVN